MALNRIILAFLLTCSSSASGNDLQLPGAPFSHQGVELIWKATNQLPSTLWVYKEADGDFSPEMTAKILALGGFKESDKKKVSGQYPVRHKHLVRYESSDGTRKLDIIPTLGWVDYEDSRAVVTARRDGKSKVFRLLSRRKLWH